MACHQNSGPADDTTASLEGVGGSNKEKSLNLVQLICLNSAHGHTELENARI